MTTHSRIAEASAAWSGLRPFSLGAATSLWRRSLQISACATVALAPLEGYLINVQSHLAKVPAVVLTLIWTVLRVRERRLPLPHPVHALLAALATVLFVSSAAHAGAPFTLEYLLRWLPFLVLTVVLIDVAARDLPLRALVGSAVVGATAAALGAMVGMVSAGETRASGPLNDPNDLAYFLVAALPLLVAVAPVGCRGRFGVLPVTMGAVLVVGAAATFSRGGALALLVATGVLVARRVLSWRVLAISALVLAIFGVVVTTVAGAELSRAVQEKTYIAGTNVDTRELRWQSAARMLVDSPVLGVGPGGFRTEYAGASHNAEIDEQTPVAHNMYLEVGAELGVPGMVLFFGIIGTALVASERMRRQSADARLMVALQASLAAVLVASTFLSEQYYLPLWLPIAAFVAADLRSQHTRKEVVGAGSARDQ